MSIPTNKQRASWAGAAIEHYLDAKTDGEILRDTTENIVIDLLCDLMHYGGRNGFDLEHAFGCAQSNFQDEEIERHMDLVHELPYLMTAMKKARDELLFQQRSGARGTNDTETREALHALNQAIAKIEGETP